MATEKQFDFNDVGVCMNPNTQSIASGNYRATIKTALIDNKWYCGIDTSTPVSGWGYGVSESSKEKFDTEQDAIAYIAQRASEWFQHELKQGMKVPQFIFDELKALSRPRPIQLSLFD